MFVSKKKYLELQEELNNQIIKLSEERLLLKAKIEYLETELINVNKNISDVELSDIETGMCFYCHMVGDRILLLMDGKYGLYFKNLSSLQLVEKMGLVDTKEEVLKYMKENGYKAIKS